MKERPILFSGPMVRALLDGTKTQTRRMVRLPSIIEAQPDGESAAELNGLTTMQWLPEHEGGPGFYGWMTEHPEEGGIPMRCPYGQPGDRLWVREAWQYYDWNDIGEPCIRYAADEATAWPEPSADDWSDKLLDIWSGLSAPANYNIDNHARDRRWRHSIHMPRWASRITLEIMGVRVERLQDISPADCEAEGVQRLPLQEDDPNPWYTADVAAGPVLHSRSTIGAYHKLWEQINGPGSWDASPWVWVMEFRGITP